MNTICIVFHTSFFGADERTRTADLILTKDALYLLSYTSTFHSRKTYISIVENLAEVKR